MDHLTPKNKNAARNSFGRVILPQLLEIVKSESRMFNREEHKDAKGMNKKANAFLSLAKHCLKISVRNFFRNVAWQFREPSARGRDQ